VEFHTPKIASQLVVPVLLLVVANGDIVEVQVSIVEQIVTLGVQVLLLVPPLDPMEVLAWLALYLVQLLAVYSLVLHQDTPTTTLLQLQTLSLPLVVQVILPSERGRLLPSLLKLVTRPVSFSSLKKSFAGDTLLVDQAISVMFIATMANHITEEDLFSSPTITTTKLLAMDLVLAINYLTIPICSFPTQQSDSEQQCGSG